MRWEDNTRSIAPGACSMGPMGTLVRYNLISVHPAIWTAKLRDLTYLDTLRNVLGLGTSFKLTL